MNRERILRLLIESGEFRPERLESIIYSMSEKLSDEELQSIVDIYSIEDELD